MQKQMVNNFDVFIQQTEMIKQKKRKPWPIHSCWQHQCMFSKQKNNSGTSIMFDTDSLKKHFGNDTVKEKHH